MSDVDEEEEVSVISACCEEHGLVVGNDDGSFSRLVPIKEGRSMPLGATGIAQIRRGSEPGKVRVAHLHRAGPSRVATPRYREGWDAVFGKKLDPSLN